MSRWLHGLLAFSALAGIRQKRHKKVLVLLIFKNDLAFLHSNNPVTPFSSSSLLQIFSIQGFPPTPNIKMFGKGKNRYFGLRGFNLNLAIGVLAGLDFL